MTTVCDFDGTLVLIPDGIRQTIGNHLDYVADQTPNYGVLARIGNEPITVVTGRTKAQATWIEDFCLNYGIDIAVRNGKADIHTTPDYIWSCKDATRLMREHKARTINNIKPSRVFDDDAEVLKMVECKEKYLVGRDGKVTPF